MIDEKIILWTHIEHLLSLMNCFREGTGKSVDISDVREKVWETLRHIHDTSSLLLTESDAYYVVFALTVHCDELAQKYSGNIDNWHSLQYQLYKTTNGGDMFFGYLDAILGRNDINSTVYEVYYFCLSDGFSGKYMENLSRLSSYRDEARSRISTHILESSPISDDKQKQALRRIPAWSYYAIAAAVVIISHFFLLSSADSYSSEISEYLLGW